MMSVSTCSAAMAASYYEKDDRNYYVKGQQADQEARWHGKGLAKEGMQEGQTVEPETFTRMLEESGRGCSAYDCTFSAPKSVSIAAEAGDSTLARDMMESHRAAVARTLVDLERNEVGYITRKDGVDIWVQTGEADIADFVHGVSREGDPQLHSHCLFINRTWDADGQQRTIDGHKFFEAQKSYGAEYRAFLAQELQKRGYEIVITDEKQGFFELKGMEPETLERFSKRRAEILAEMERNGERGAEAAQRANLATRKTKKAIDAEQARAAWQRELAEIGQELPRSTGKPIQIEADKGKIYKAALHDIERASFAFTDKQLREAVIARGVKAGMTVADAQAMIASDPNLLRGELENVKQGEIWLTTKRNMDIDESIEANYIAARGTLRNGITRESAAALLDAAETPEEYKLNSEQRNAAETILASRSQQMCCQGLAGVGKTFMVSRVVSAAAEYNKTAAPGEQIHFVGLAPSGKAASGLLEESGIEQGGTVHSFLNQLTGYKPRKGEPIKNEWNDWSKAPKAQGREIVFVDEAGMMDNQLIFELQKMAAARSGPAGQVQLVYMGDYSQLPPVGAAEPFHHLTDIDKTAGTDGNTVFMTNIQRQKDAALLQAVNESVKGDHLITFEKLAAKGDYREVRGEQSRRKAAAREMTEGVPLDKYGENLLIVGTNRDRAAYNALIRAEYVRRGELDAGETYEITVTDGEKERTEQRQFAKGERVIFLANNKKIGVMNGQMGQIVGIDGQTFTIRKDDGRTVTINMAKYNNIDQAWSVTNYKAQGMSIGGKVVCDMSTTSKQQHRNDLYVDVSRAKRRAIVITDDKKKLEKQTRNWAHKIQRSDFKRIVPAQSFSKGGKHGAFVVRGAKAGMQAAGAAMQFTSQVMKGAGQIIGLVPLIGKPLQAVIDIPAAAMQGAGRMAGTAGKAMSPLEKAEQMAKTGIDTLAEVGKSAGRVAEGTISAGREVAGKAKKAVSKEKKSQDINREDELDNDFEM